MSLLDDILEKGNIGVGHRVSDLNWVNDDFLQMLGDWLDGMDSEFVDDLLLFGSLPLVHGKGGWVSVLNSKHHGWDSGNWTSSDWSWVDNHGGFLDNGLVGDQWDWDHWGWGETN